LDAEIEKYDNWANINKSINIKGLFASNRQFQRCKKQGGVGQTTILKFLGGNWKRWVVEDALSTIKGIEAGN